VFLSTFCAAVRAAIQIANFRDASACGWIAASILASPESWRIRVAAESKRLRIAFGTAANAGRQPPLRCTRFVSAMPANLVIHVSRLISRRRGTLPDRGLSARNNPGTLARGKKGTTIRGLC